MKRLLLCLLLVCVAESTFAQSVTYSQQGALTGTITSSSSIVGPFVSYPYSMASVSISGSYTGLSAVFEFNDGSGWYSAFGVRTDASIQETGPASISNAARMWDISLFGTTQFRVRATNWESGTANVSVILHATPVEAAPTVVTAPGSVVQVTGATPGSPGIIPVNPVSAPPPLTPLQLSNPLLYRAAMRVYCQTNLAGCGPGL